MGISWLTLLERNNQNVVDDRQLQVDRIATGRGGVVSVLPISIKALTTVSLQ
jgi:hypothetical protein